MVIKIKLNSPICDKSAPAYKLSRQEFLVSLKRMVLIRLFIMSTENEINITVPVF